MFGWNRRPRVVAFDVIGTLFPLVPLRPALVALGLQPSALEAWFAAGLRDAFALAAAGDFAPFPKVLRAALDQVLAEQGLSPPATARARVLAQMGRLPPRADARPAFELLARAGLRIMALSNGARASTWSLLDAARLDAFVEGVVSVEDVRAFKPLAEVYAHAARAADARARHMALVAVHPWDVNGAKAAGWTTAYVTAERPFPPVMRRPDVVAPTLVAAARALVAI